MNIEPYKFSGVYLASDGKKLSLATQNLTPGVSVYGEKIVKINQEEYRLWAPRRSKLAAAIKNGLENMPIRPGSRVLYLGAASGTTVSHVSDIVGINGIVNAVEFAITPARDLLSLASNRNNIIPILEDARYPSRFAPLVAGPIDVVYQDVAQPDQSRILLENMRTFCSIGTWALLALKIRSIDSTSRPLKILKQEIQLFTDLGFNIIEQINLAPFEKDHFMLVLRLAEVKL